MMERECFWWVYYMGGCGYREGGAGHEMGVQWDFYILLFVRAIVGSFETLSITHSCDNAEYYR